MELKCCLNGKLTTGLEANSHVTLLSVVLIAGIEKFRLNLSRLSLGIDGLYINRLQKYQENQENIILVVSLDFHEFSCLFHYPSV